MAKEIIGAKIIGRAQNRTALGMVTAFVKMHPDFTLTQLKKQFPKEEVAPECGTPQIFYTTREIKQAQDSGNTWFDNACFTEKDEIIVLGNGEKVTLVKMWTENNLAKLQQALAEYHISGTVDRKHKGKVAGFTISYQYQHIKDDVIEDEEEVHKLSPIFWVMVLLAIIVGGYFAYTHFFN